jgi:hypothetical protein
MADDWLVSDEELAYGKFNVLTMSERERLKSQTQHRDVC